METTAVVEHVKGIDIEAIKEATIIGEPLCTDENGKLYPVDLLVNTWEILTVLETLKKNLKGQLIGALSIRGPQSIPGKPGYVFDIKRTKGRETINGMKAGPIIREVFTLDECDTFVTIVKGKMVDALKAKTPKGEKEKAAEALLEALREAEATSRGRDMCTPVIRRRDEA